LPRGTEKNHENSIRLTSLSLKILAWVLPNEYKAGVVTTQSYMVPNI